MRVRHLVSAAALALGLGVASAAVGCATLVGADFGERTLEEGGSCYGGPPGTEGVAACQAGRLEGGVCVGEVLPALEMCTTADLDENCDGLATCDGAAIAARSFGDGEDQLEIRAVVDAEGSVIFAVAAAGQVEYGGGPRGGTGMRDVHVVKLGRDLDVHEWSVVFTGGTDHYVTSLALDQDGNILVAGFYNGSIAIGTETLAGAGMADWDIFIAKLEPSQGATLWARSWASAGENVVQSVALGPDGSILVAGWTEGVLDLGDGVVVTSLGAADAFVAKLDAEGRALWARSWGDGYQQRALGVAVGPSGDVAVVGDFEGVVDFGSGPATNAGPVDGFVVVVDKDGTFRWARALQSAAAVRVIDAAVSRVNYLLITGSHAAVDLDFGMPVGPAPYVGGTDAYLAAYRLTDGVPQWVRSYGDVGDQVGVRLAVDGAGNVLWTGSTNGAVTFDGQQALTSNAYDAFAVKLAPPSNAGPGQVIWGQLLGGDLEQYGVEITAGPLGNVVVGGYTSTDFKIGTIPVEHAGAYDVWIASLRP